jgi:FkbM family methyltransferase
VKNRRICVQAGGNLGVFPKYLARFFQTVLTFEPSPDLFPLLAQNAPEPNVVRLQAALGERPGLIGMRCTRRGSKAGPIHEGLTHVHGAGSIPTMRLDDLGLPVLDLLYLDLEGFELYALRGAAETVKRCRPIIVMEVNQNIEFYGIARDDVRQHVIGQGYQFVRRIQADEVYVPC